MASEVAGVAWVSKEPRPKKNLDPRLEKPGDTYLVKMIFIRM